MRRVDSFSEYKACSVSGAIPNITCFYFLSAPLDRLRRPEPQRSRQGSETDALTAAFYCAGALRLLFMVPVRGDKQGDGGDKLGQDKDPEGKCVQCLASVHAPIGQAVPNLESPDQSVTEAEKAAAAISRPDRMIQPLTQSTQASSSLGLVTDFIRRSS